MERKLQIETKDVKKRNSESRNTKDFWKCKSNLKKLIFTGGSSDFESCSSD